MSKNKLVFDVGLATNYWNQISNSVVDIVESKIYTPIKWRVWWELGALIQNEATSPGEEVKTHDREVDS